MGEPEDDGLPVHIEIGRSRVANGALIAKLEAEVAEMTVRAEAGEAKVGRLGAVGAQFANWAYNMCQRDPMHVDGHERDELKLLQERWDAALVDKERGD